MNELIQLLKDEQIQIKESSSSSYSYHTTLFQSFKRTYSIIKRSTSDKGSSFPKHENEDEEVSSTFEQRRGKRSTLGRNMENSSSNKEDEICSKAPIKGNDPSRLKNLRREKLPVYKCTHCKKTGHFKYFCFKTKKI